MKKTRKTDVSEVFGLPMYYQTLCKVGTGLGYTLRHWDFPIHFLWASAIPTPSSTGLLDGLQGQLWAPAWKDAETHSSLPTSVSHTPGVSTSTYLSSSFSQEDRGSKPA